MAMVKANAYGTGDLDLIPYLKQFGIKMLGVSHVNEGIHLRKAGVDMPIFVISAPPFEAGLVVRYHLQPAVSSLEEIQALNQFAKETVPVHLHVNTGMNRFGAHPNEICRLEALIRQSPLLKLEGIMTHFACADSPEHDDWTIKQIDLFKQVVASLEAPPPMIHAANGPGAIRFTLPFCNLVRIGVPLFGYGFPSELEPALSLESHIAFIHHSTHGEAIGYQGSYRIKHEKMRIGVIPFGYYDGLHRHYKEKGYVLIHGKQAPMVGHICMDFMMVDLSEIPEAQVGDPVTLFDSQLSPETVAKWGNTDVRELLASIGPRTKRLFIHQPSTPPSDYERFSKFISPLKEDPAFGEHLIPT